MNQRLAVYAGTFDPLTVGHMWMIEQGVNLFDRLIVAIGINPGKKCLFSVEERLEMLRESTKHLSGLEITSFTNQFLFNYAHSIGAQYVLRGIRTESDYEYERVMRNVNGDLGPDITIVFLMPPRDIAEISSSMVEELIGPEGWRSVIKGYVPEPVFKKIKEKFSDR